LAARAAKAEAIRARDENPYSNELYEEPLVPIGELRRRFDEAKVPDGKYDAARGAALGGGRPVRVAGRVIAARTFGKASFLRLRDREGDIQLFCRTDALGDGFARLEDIEVADFIEAIGVPMVTQKGELSVEPSRLRLLTKAL